MQHLLPHSELPPKRSGSRLSSDTPQRPLTFYAIEKIDLNNSNFIRKQGRKTFRIVDRYKPKNEPKETLDEKEGQRLPVS